MLKDRIIELDGNKSYYVYEEVDYNNKKYILTSECDVTKDLINDEEYLVMEVVLEDSDLHIKQLKDDNLAKIITTLLLSKMRDEKGA